MNKRKVEFELDINKLAAWVAVIAPVIGGLWWIYDVADTSSDTAALVKAMPPPPALNSTESLVKQLSKGQIQLQKEEEFRQVLWGKDYRKKISGLLNAPEQ